MSDNGLLILLAVPFLGALLLAILPTGRRVDGATGNSGDSLVRSFAVMVSAATLVLSLVLTTRFDIQGSGFAFQTVKSWVPQFGIQFHVGLDGMGLVFVVLTALMTLLAVLFSSKITHRLKEFMVCLLLLEGGILGVFSALDLVLYYVCWEIVLVPMYFLIAIWGGERRQAAATKFFVYTFAGSVLMLVGIIFVFVQTRTLDLELLTNQLSPAHKTLQLITPRSLLLVYGSFVLAFMVKIPMFPFHTWQADLYANSPIAGVVMSSVMVKMGVYSLLRIAIPLFPAQAKLTAPIMIGLSVFAIIYGGVVAAAQTDMRRLLAYSSLSHMGFITLGIYSFNQLGITGAIYQSINHSITAALLFFAVGMLVERRNSAEIMAFGGVKRALPGLTAFFMIGLLASVALPLTNGFVGEFLILQGSFTAVHSGMLPTALAATGMVLSVVYMLWMFQRVFTGPVTEPVKQMRDITSREQMILAPLVVLVFLFGCFSASFTPYLSGSVDDIVLGLRSNRTAGKQVTLSPRNHTSR